MRRRPLLMFGTGLVALLAAVPAAAAVRSASERDGREAVSAVTPLGTAFTFQGRLSDGSAPANGNYDIRFILYDADAGGTQVGQTVTKSPVPVTTGLFTVQLDFGADAFGGDARWLEVAVRPVGSSGIYSVLNPRQPITPVPYALFAKVASLALPFGATGGNTGTGGLFAVTQSDSGIALAGKRTYTGTTAGPAVFGTNAGAGAGVQGESTNASGTGVVGIGSGTNGTGVEGSSSGTSGTGGRFSGPVGVVAAASGAAGVALELSNGPIRVSGTTKGVFQHSAVPSGAGANVCTVAGPFDGTIIDNPLTNGDASALLLVTQAKSVAAPAVGDFLSFFVAYSPSGCTGATGKWVIFTNKSPLVAADRFNVMVVKQ